MKSFDGGASPILYHERQNVSRTKGGEEGKKEKWCSSEDFSVKKTDTVEVLGMIFTDRLKC